MADLPVGKRAVVFGGRHFGRAGVVAEVPDSFPRWYQVRLDGGDVVRVEDYNLAAVTP